MKALNFLSKDDYFEVRLGSMLASYDRDILTILYQPIISHFALSLYFTLWSEVKYREFNILQKHDVLSKKMNMDISEIFESRKKLEAIGLLKTYRKKIDKSKYEFIYVLYAPKSPKEFFDDVLYKGLLAKHLGAKEVEKLSILFSTSDKIGDDLTEITADFVDVYNYDEESTIRVMNVKNGRSRKTINIQAKFEIGNFLKELKEQEGISPDAITPTDIQEISRIATLFGHDEKTMIEIVSHIYHYELDNHIDYDELFSVASKMKEGLKIFDNQEVETKTYSENDAYGKLLNIFNTYAPFEYLRLKQNNTNPAPADINIINMLSTKYGFTNPVINAIIDYTLIKCDDSLPLAYVEKIASVIARKNITTALGCMNALTKKKVGKKKKNEPIVTNDNLEIEDDISNEDLLKALSELENS